MQITNGEYRVKKLSKLLASILLLGLLSSSIYGEDNAKMVLINEAKTEVGEVTPDQLKELIDDENVVVLDVRESEQEQKDISLVILLPLRLFQLHAVI